MILMEFLLHQVALQVVERNKKNSMILIGVFFFAYMSNFFWTQFDENKFRQHPFPFHGEHRDGTYTNQLISDAAYTDYAAKALSWAVVIFALCLILPEYREILFVISFLFFGYAVEFAMIYNDPITWWHDPFFHVALIPIGFSTFAGIALIAMFIYKYFEK
jgi:hypothetical protein